jgi:hypothetical protein
MKKLLILATLISASFAASAHNVSKAEVKFAGDRDFSGFCKAVLEDDVSMLKRNVRAKIGLVAPSSDEVLKRLIAEDGMQCNGADLVTFSIERDASSVHAYLAKAI